MLQLSGAFSQSESFGAAGFDAGPDRVIFDCRLIDATAAREWGCGPHVLAPLSRASTQSFTRQSSTVVPPGRNREHLRHGRPDPSLSVRDSRLWTRRMPPRFPRREALHGSTNYCMHQELEILYSLAPSQIPWPGDLLRRRESIVSHFRAVSRWWWWRLLCPPAAEGLYVEMGSPSVAVTE